MSSGGRGGAAQAIAPSAQRTAVKAARIERSSEGQREEGLPLTTDCGLTLGGEEKGYSFPPPTLLSSGRAGFAGTSFARICSSISLASSGRALRNSRALSLPWPMRSPL